MSNNISGQAVIDTLMSLLSGEGQEIEEKMAGIDIYQSRVEKALKYLRLARAKFSQVIVTDKGRVALKVDDAKTISNILEAVKMCFSKDTQMQNMAARLCPSLSMAIEDSVKKTANSD